MSSKEEKQKEEKRKEEKKEEGKEEKKEDENECVCFCNPIWEHLVNNESMEKYAMLFIKRLHNYDIKYSFHYVENKSKPWKPHYKIIIQESMREFTQNKACGMSFTENDQDSDIRIAIEWEKNKKSWSSIGKVSNEAKSEKMPTMSIYGRDIKKRERRYMILHQIGHALGLDHELGRNYTGANSRFDKENLINFMKTYNWNEKLVQDKILKHHALPTDSDGFTTHDDKSIMCYPFSKDIETKPLPINKVLSKQDVWYIQRLYPVKSEKRGESCAKAICRRLEINETSDVYKRILKYAQKVFPIEKGVSQTFNNSVVGVAVANNTGKIKVGTTIGSINGTSKLTVNKKKKKPKTEKKESTTEKKIESTIELGTTIGSASGDVVIEINEEDETDEDSTDDDEPKSEPKSETETSKPVIIMSGGQLATGRSNNVFYQNTTNVSQTNIDDGAIRIEKCKNVVPLLTNGTTIDMRVKK